MKIDLYQTFGTIATILSIISLLCKNKKSLLKIQLISNFLYSLQYLVINAISASYVTLVAMLRCILFTNENNKIKKLIFLIILAIIAGLFSFDGTFLSFIPIINSIICIYGASLKNVKHYKLVYGAVSAIWIYYNFKVGATVIIIANICEIIAAIIGYFRNENK